MPMQNPFSTAKIQALTERVLANNKAQIIRLTNELTEENQRAIAGSFGDQVPIQRFVDGVLGKPLEQVKPDGVTLTEFELIGHVVDAVLQELFQVSPYGPEKGGHYRDDHWLFVNGQRRDASVEGGAVRIDPTDKVVIINTRPYARKIEGGARRRSGGRASPRRPGLSVQAPDGVYEITARKMAGRLGNIAVINFTYLALAGTGRFPAIEIEART